MGLAEDARARYRKVADLYVEGDVHVLRDGTQVWVQSLNSFEIEECRSAARVMRAKVINALRKDGSLEAQQVHAAVQEFGREGAIRQILAAKDASFILKVTAAIDADPEWSETMELIARGNDSALRPPTPEEQAEIEEAGQRYVKEVNDAVEAERKTHREYLESLSQPRLHEEAVQAYIQTQGSQLSLDEFRIHELALACRTCDAELVDGRWQHKIPLHERVQIWTAEEIRALPEQMLQELRKAIDAFKVQQQEAKDLADATPSSESSLPPNEEEEESTPSGPKPTPAAPRGGSRRRLTTH